MNTQTRRFGYALACTALSFTALAYASAAVAAPVTGVAKARLTHVFATLQNGQPDTKPEDIAACKKQVSSPNSRYLGITVSTHYSVDAQTMIMSAFSKLPSPHATKPVVLTIKLAPLGIAGEYAFGAFRPTELPDTYVLYSMGTDFKNPKSSILVLNEGKEFNCLVSSDASPFSGGVSAKLGADQK
jgi:hypothetical protein